jgi:hypothetical protein
MAETDEFEEWFNDEYPLPPTIERGQVGRNFKKGCEKAYEAGYVAGSNAGYAEALNK